MNIMNAFGIVDVVIVLAVIIFAIIGWKSGFLEKVIGFAKGIFGLLGSIILARPFAEIITPWIGPAVQEKVLEYLTAHADQAFSQVLNEDNVRTALTQMNLPTFLVDWVATSVDYQQASQSIINAIEPIVTQLALLIIAFVTLFFGSMIVFFILKLLAKLITSIPVVKQIDKFFGLLFGIVKVAVIIYVLLFVLALLLTIPAINDAIGPWLQVDMQLDNENFRLSKYLYNNNLLNFFL